MTKAELLARISSEEITEWMAFYVIRGEERKKAADEAKRKSRQPRRR